MKIRQCARVSKFINPAIQKELQPLISDSYWLRIRDANPGARELYKRHYSRRIYRDMRDPKKFIGPGQYLCLVLPEFKALFAWRKFISMDNQVGINCAIFRRESGPIASVLILDAERWAWARWSNEHRLYTYVNPKKIQSANPGYCFLVAGWRKCGITKGGLIILEKLKDRANPPCPI